MDIEDIREEIMDNIAEYEIIWKMMGILVLIGAVIGVIGLLLKGDSGMAAIIAGSVLIVGVLGGGLGGLKEGWILAWIIGLFIGLILGPFIGLAVWGASGAFIGSYVGPISGAAFGWWSGNKKREMDKREGVKVKIERGQDV